MGRDTTAEKLKEDEAHQKAGGVTDKAGGTRSAGAGEQEALREAKQGPRPNVDKLLRIGAGNCPQARGERK